MTYPISDKVLQEILRAFAWEDAALPSEDAVRELAAAAGQTDETIKSPPIPVLTKRAAAKAIRGKLCKIMSRNSDCTRF